MIGDSLSGVGLDGVQEAAVLPLGADETNAVEGGVVQAPLVGLHLQRQEVVPRDGCLSGSHVMESLKAKLCTGWLKTKHAATSKLENSHVIASKCTILSGLECEI